MGARLLWGIRECSGAGQRRWLHTSEHAKATDAHSGMREPQGTGTQFNKAAGGGPAEALPGRNERCSVSHEATGYQRVSRWGCTAAGTPPSTGKAPEQRGPGSCQGPATWGDHHRACRDRGASRTWDFRRAGALTARLRPAFHMRPPHPPTPRILGLSPAAPSHFIP